MAEKTETGWMIKVRNNKSVDEYERELKDES